MRKYYSILLLLMFVATDLSAQSTDSTVVSNSFFQGMDTSDYNRICASYNPVWIGWNEPKRNKVKEFPLNHSLSLGYLHASNIAKNSPLYIEYGANVQYSFGEKRVTEGDGQLESRYTYTAQMLSINLPVNVAMRFELKSKTGKSKFVTPYIGVNLRYGAWGNIKLERGYLIAFGPGYAGGTKWTRTYRLFDDSDDSLAMGDKAFDRFQVGINFGAGFTYDKLYLGLGCVADIMKIINSQETGYVGRFNTVTISVGIAF